MRDVAVNRWLASRETETVANCLQEYLESAKSHRAALRNWWLYVSRG
jgi:hypothetical protein